MSFALKEFPAQEAWKVQWHTNSVPFLIHFPHQNLKQCNEPQVISFICKLVSTMDRSHSLLICGNWDGKLQHILTVLPSISTCAYHGMAWHEDCNCFTLNLINLKYRVCKIYILSCWLWTVCVCTVFVLKNHVLVNTWSAWLLHQNQHKT